MNANAGWIIPFIILGGALQSCGAAMNGQLNKHVVNPWLASAISFALTTFFFAGASLIHPHPLPTQKDLAELPWWAVGSRRRPGGSSAGLRGPYAGQ
jgi:transporter family-2 protein